MTLDELKKAALDGLGTVLPKDKPTAAAMDYYTPGIRQPLPEQGLNETNGLDVLREPKEIAERAVGPGAMQQLIQSLVPDEVSPQTMMSGVGVLKPKTAMKNLKTPGTPVWDKDAVSAAVAEKLGGDSSIPMWKKKMMQPKN